MGFFSERDIERYGNSREDRSFPSEREQLLWRLTDLYDRLEELMKEKVPYQNGTRYPDREIRCALPEHLGDIRSVERAIELAREERNEKIPEPSVWYILLYAETRNRKVIA